MTKRILTPVLIVGFLAACSSNESNRSPEQKEMDIQSAVALEESRDGSSQTYKKNESGSMPFISSSAVKLNPGDSLHRFVRTADLKFRVDDVVESTYAIEDFAARHNGYVEKTNLASTVNSQTEIRISEDSSMQITDYTVTNTITLRVPFQKMDTLLKDIATTVEYLDYRNIKARNVSFDLLSNQLTQLRSERMQQRVGNAIATSNSTATDKTTAAEALARQEQSADEAFIENKRMEDKISYATIELKLYQKNEQHYHKIAIVPAVDEYQPGFGTRAANAFETGWNILVEFLLLLARLWVLLLFALIGYFLYRRSRKNKKTPLPETAAKS